MFWSSVLSQRSSTLWVTVPNASIFGFWGGATGWPPGLSEVAQARGAAEGAGRWALSASALALAAAIFSSRLISPAEGWGFGASPGVAGFSSAIVDLLM